MFLLFQLKDMKDPKGVSVDWVTKTVYVADWENQSITALSVEDKKKITLIYTAKDYPFDVAVDPQSG